MQLIDVIEDEMLEDDSFTLSYYPDVDLWVSFHDWVSEGFISLRNSILSFKQDAVWLHNAEGRGVYYDEKHVCSITPIYNWKQIYPEFVYSLSWLADVGKDRLLNSTFTSILLANSYQATNEKEIVVYDDSKTLEQNYDIYNTKRIKSYWNFNQIKSLTINTDFPKVIETIDDIIEASGNVDQDKEFYLKRPFIDNWLLVKLSYDGVEPLYVYEVVIQSRPVLQ